jgi:D-alanyl-D-alanine carboxypeptidase
MPKLDDNISFDQESLASAFLASLIKEKQAPGVQYVFADKDRVLFEFVTGYADVSSRQPITRQTTFNAYSLTKTFTAAAVAKLALLERIDLDEPIARYVSGLPYGQSPTVRQTLQHTAGFPNPNPMSWVHLVDQDLEFNDTNFFRQVIKENPKLDFEPGSKSVYSNIGYLVLGQFIAEVSGQSYEDFIIEEVIAPLDLNDDQVISYHIEKPDNHAYGYIRRWNWLNPLLGLFIDRKKFLVRSEEGWTRFNHMMVNGKPYGGLVGNTAGFIRYLQAILRREAPFTDHLVETMWKLGATNGGQPIPRGLAWYHSAVNGKPYFMHTGGAAGYYSEMRIYPDDNRASVIMTNSTGITSQNYLNRIDSLLF